MKAKSIKGKSANEIKLKLEECMADGFQPTLAVVFLSIKQDRNTICELLNKENIAIYGVTTNGEFIDAELGMESIAILLLDIKKDYFTILFDEYPDKDYREVSRALAKKSLESFSNPAFLIAYSDLETDAEELLQGFEDVIAGQVSLFGGLGGDDIKLMEEYVFTNGKSSNSGVVVVALDSDNILIKGRAMCGWKPVGTEKTVPKSDGNRIYLIDGIPPTELTMKYSGILELPEDNTEAVILLSQTLPFELQREQGDPIMRVALINKEDGSFTCMGTIPEGSKVKFALPPDFDAIDQVIKGCEELKEEEMPEADAVIVFSCGGRLLTFGPMMSKEIEGIQKVWDVPMAGFFCNSELARATGGKLELHNLTTCCVALKEK